MTERKLDDWLAGHLEYTDNTESPISYHTWSGVFAIASALERKVFMRQSMSQIYPNVYILLIGPTGGRKGIPVMIARDYLEELNTMIIEEDITEEALIQQMKAAGHDFIAADTNRRWFQSPISICAEELSVFLQEKNTRFQAYLTNWYDSRHRWSRRTKQSTTEHIVGVCVNLLGSTAPSWLPYMLSREAVGGGFTARCIFVVEQAKRQTILDPNEFPPDESLRQALLHDLEVIHTLQGEYKFSPDAKDAYKDFYRIQEENVLRGNPIFNVPYLEGYESRRQTHLMKLSLSMCVSRSNEQVVHVEDIERAAALLLETEKNMAYAFTGVGGSKFVRETEAVLAYLRSRGEATRSELMKAFYRDIDDVALESIVNVLSHMKVIEVHIVSGNERRYILKED